MWISKAQYLQDQELIRRLFDDNHNLRMHSLELIAESLGWRRAFINLENSLNPPEKKMPFKYFECFTCNVSMRPIVRCGCYNCLPMLQKEFESYQKKLKNLYKILEFIQKKYQINFLDIADLLLDDSENISK